MIEIAQFVVDSADYGRKPFVIMTHRKNRQNKKTGRKEKEELQQ